MTRLHQTGGLKLDAEGAYMRGTFVQERTVNSWKRRCSPNRKTPVHPEHHILITYFVVLQVWSPLSFSSLFGDRLYSYFKIYLFQFLFYPLTFTDINQNIKRNHFQKFPLLSVIFTYLPMQCFKKGKLYVPLKCLDKV